MNLLIESETWQENAQTMPVLSKIICQGPSLRYRLDMVKLTQNSAPYKSRGKNTCAQQHSWHLFRFLGFRPATARWMNAPQNASAPVRLLAALQQHLWTETQSKALLSVALLVVSPAKTDRFGINRLPKQLNSFISPLLHPLRVSGRGLFSWPNASLRRLAGMPARSKSALRLNGDF